MAFKSSDMIKEFQVAAHFAKLINQMSKKYIPTLLLSSVFRASAPFVNIIMPKFIIDELLGNPRIIVLSLYVVIIVLGNLLFNLINSSFDRKTEIINLTIEKNLEFSLGKHVMDIDYMKLEDSSVLNMKEEAMLPIKTQYAFQRMINSFTDIIKNIIIILALAAIMWMIGYEIIIFVIVIALLNSIVFNKLQKNQAELNLRLMPLNRKFMYYMNLIRDFSTAGDMRVYDMEPFISNKIDEFNESIVKSFKKIYSLQGMCEGICNILTQVQSIFIYSFMIYKVLAGALTVGWFLVGINISNEFSKSISDITNKFIEFRQMCRYLNLYVNFMKIPIDKKYDSQAKIDKKDIKIEFKNVYFKYSGSDDYVLKNISIVINDGDKISVVGANGAGKTTFIKLICRLCRPESGEILLNGLSIYDYKYDEYIDMISVVFQDFKLFAYSIKENITFENSTNVSDDIIEKIIEKVGLDKKISKLKNGIHTNVYKYFDENGTDLSGGEAQKLAIGRAMFKNSRIMILDEPTSALDPYAENEFYSDLNKYVKDMTTIYISHRLSSCLFCDTIVIFEKGEIVECGRHSELLMNKGKYFEMWNAQASYYIN